MQFMITVKKVKRMAIRTQNTEAIARKYQAPLVLELAEDLSDVRVDAIHLEQLILNLILNGFEAMEMVNRQFRELRIWTVKQDEKFARVSQPEKGVS
jgi:C4-dicarboxylate-specific signal transduction histidine kinase